MAGAEIKAGALVPLLRGYKLAAGRRARGFSRRPAPVGEGSRAGRLSGSGIEGIALACPGIANLTKAIGRPT